MKKYLISILALFFLALFQQSFVNQFKFFGTKLNLVLISIFFLNFFESSESKFGIFAGFLGGGFLEFCSSSLLGTFSLTLGLVACFIKKIGNYFQKSNILSGILIFFLSFLLYKTLFSFWQEALNYIFQKNFNFVLKFNIESLSAEFLYNLVVVFILLIIAKKYGFFGKS